MIKPSIPKGTRDFGPVVVRKRNYIFQTIRETFEVFGFQPLETPAMENLSTLTGKYGEEGDKLIFRILDNGEIFDRAREAKDNRELVNSITEKALRYDLTIPFARYVVMNQHELALPFKRYQMQPVWRGDRPAKGRYREFYQCDADVVGSNSLLNEVELLLIYDTVFTKLGMQGYELRINNRKILAALADLVGKPELLTDITISIDKLDKIGIDGVRKELQERGLTEGDIKIIENFLNIKGDNQSVLEQLRELFADSATGLRGIEELDFVLDSEYTSYNTTPILDLTLARGLNYYTGLIVEVKAPATVKMGSIGGGGRYDDLTGLFGLPGISGVGISFGVDRIYDVLEELNLFPETAQQSTRVLFLNLGLDSSIKAFSYVMQLRQKGIPAELYHESSKMDKQMKYADKRSIPFVAILGESELAENSISIKDLKNGKQEKISLDALLHYAF
ncbi:histidyl-tRNA synthetase [Chitinophaga terrae (ex Kim and Jung 2007)]|uniref:Histidine--tRNA ligase n=1 Tax=Chitinophaga terrae (ex Kim and Jung 2007) TaxID=408074 RepID=A0A1H4DNG2_9BACT|nr:histidine--tRNA ligase [Chitinophaga terrae (ex Kim and Jung 2007)]GEP91031.1 histidine--tRNA ligase [Chitinophaga terrae (ex Kim and Jung 2007)]SEA74323.1 histidyl-tRNA synthetase [Chitinophaga terrae (ex Kim and Jung 2007)]